MRARMNRSLLLLVASAVIACAHTPPVAEGASSGEASAAADAALTQTAWKDMTRAERGRYMTKVVVPKMKPLFQAYAPTHFETFNCATCHGKSGKERNFKMPTPDLPVLPASEKEFMATVMKDKPEWVKFMAEQVTPTMAALLGRKPFNPKAPERGAFSCEGCHELRGKPDARVEL
jgi:cytochrome c553